MKEDHNSQQKNYRYYENMGKRAAVNHYMWFRDEIFIYSYWYYHTLKIEWHMSYIEASVVRTTML